MALFERFSDDYFRVINQAGVRMARPAAAGNENYNCCWDAALSPEGDLYFALSSEQGRSEHAKLVRYDYPSNEIVECYYVGDIVLPNARQLPHSKLHTSINFLPDGRVIATTHSTDKARQHPGWLPFGHHNHVWEGFPGSAIIVYDPLTGQSEFWGYPVPHESIYGATYDPAHDRLYMIGFMRGHVYSFDIATRKVEDLGKAAEVFNYRLALGADGNIYSCTKSGFVYRINTELNVLEDLGWELPDEPGHYVLNTWYKYMTCGRNDPSGKFMYWTSQSSDYLMTIDFKTLEVTRVARLIPEGGIYPKIDPTSDNVLQSFVIDREGVFWWAFKMEAASNHLTDDFAQPNHLMRWDPNGHAGSEVLGMIGTPDYAQWLTCEMEYDAERDILYCVDVGRGFGADGPNVVAIDLGEFRRHLGEPGPVSTDQFYRPRPMTPEEIRERDDRLENSEENTTANPFWAFPVEKVYPVRIWRHTPREHKENSKVIGMAFDDQDLLHVVTGPTGVFDQAVFVLRIRGHEVVDRLDFADLDPRYREWLRTTVLPQPVDEASWAAVALPEVTGRRYRAMASASAAWSDGRTIVGTRDALLAIVSQDGGVYSLGNAASYGPVRCLCTNAARTKLWGVAGDDEDLGYVFSYDDTHGLRQLGVLIYNTHGFYGPTASNVLSSIVVNKAETVLAIGGADRTATVHLIDLT